MTGGAEGETAGMSGRVRCSGIYRGGELHPAGMVAELGGETFCAAVCKCVVAVAEGEQ